MPKNQKKSTLQKARGLFLKKVESDSEESSSSEHSEEHSHIPIDGIPSVSSLYLEETTENMETEMLKAKVAELTTMLEALHTQQVSQQHTINNMVQPQGQADMLFRIPDPIKSIPKFDGNRKQLTAWLSTAESTLQIFQGIVTEQQMRIYTTAVVNKIEGKAKDIICLAGNPTSFEQVKDILITALGDRQELTYYKSQLWQTKMGDMTIHKYFNKINEIVQSIKSLAKQNPIYQQSWDAINKFIEEDALAAFISGLNEPYFGYAQAACPSDMETAYAFVCKFKSKELTAIQSEKPNKNFSKYRTNHATEQYRNHVPNQRQYRDDRNSRDDRHTRDDRHSRDDKNAREDRRESHTRSSHQIRNYNSTPQPMEIGSVRSKLTLNRRQINNHSYWQ